LHFFNFNFYHNSYYDGV